MKVAQINMAVEELKDRCGTKMVYSFFESRNDGTQAFLTPDDIDIKAVFKKARNPQDTQDKKNLPQVNFK